MKDNINVDHYNMFINLLYKSTQYYPITIEDLLSCIYE